MLVVTRIRYTTVSGDRFKDVCNSADEVIKALKVARKANGIVTFIGPNNETHVIDPADFIGGFTVGDPKTSVYNTFCEYCGSEPPDSLTGPTYNESSELPAVIHEGPSKEEILSAVDHSVRQVLNEVREEETVAKFWDWLRSLADSYKQVAAPEHGAIVEQFYNYVANVEEFDQAAASNQPEE